MNEIKNVTILAGGGGPAEPVLSKAWTGYRTTKIKKALSAFTMAEILLSLTIIGVVAAITLPSLTGNINERTWNTQRKALYARFSQAIALMPSLNGYGTLTEDESGSITDTAAETFVTEGLSKVLKINNICDSEHINDCGVPETFTTLGGTGGVSMPVTMTSLNSLMTSAVGQHSTSVYRALDTKAAAFETQNGESILLFYNPTCRANMGETANYFAQAKVCANLIYDLNGSKGPNTVGKDVGFMTFLYPTDSAVVAPMPYNRKFSGVPAADAANECTVKAGDDYRIPTKDELASIFVNQNLLGIDMGDYHLFSSSKVRAYDVSSEFTNWLLVLYAGEYRVPSSASARWGILCVKR